MRVLNIGSLNIDDVFAVDRFVRPGETIACRSYDRVPGGKGSNQSIALGRAGAQVWQAGKVGSDGGFLRSLLEASGADCSLLRESSVPTGRALIQVDSSGQNCIILFGGANHDIKADDIDAFLELWGPGDALLLQNETTCLEYAFAEGARRGLRIFFNASPVKDNLRSLPLELAGCLLVNEVEGEALTGEAEPSRMLAALRSRCPATDLVLTLGAQGLRYSGSDGQELALEAESVRVVDTTAAGDCFTGFYIAALARGEGAEAALREGIRAASICVSRPGASSSIPWRRELG